MRVVLRMSLLMIPLAVGCGGDEEKGDSGYTSILGGHGSEGEGEGESDTAEADADADTDTDTDADTDTGESDTDADTSPPTILDVSVSVEDYPGTTTGWAMELSLTYTDPDNDIDGGEVVVDLVLEGSEPQSLSVPIDGAQAVHREEDGTVFMAVEVPDSSVQGTVIVVLQDANGNRSESFELDL
jgi:hypothetical protein